jgi:hypothetical protein
MRFQVLMAVSIRDVRDVTACILVEVYWHLEEKLISIFRVQE